MANQFPKFYILDENFESVLVITHYESLLWVDRFDDCGDFEIKCIPSSEILQYAKQDNYIWSSNSDRMMIIEKISITTDADEGVKYTITGRSLESILERRILLYKTVFKDNLEDSLRQLLEVTFIKPDDSNRKISNMIFEYSHDTEINTKEVDYEFEKGTNLLEVIRSMVQGVNLGFQITLNDSQQFVFKVIKGINRSYDQDANPWIIFSPKFNNLIADKFESNQGENYKNFIYLEGESYNDQAPEELTYGSATGLLRREHYENAGDVNHKVTDIYGNETTLSDAEYAAQLNQRIKDVYNEYTKQTTIESEVEAKVNNVYGVDYFIGDIVQVEDILGFTGKVRVTEFITSHSTTGIEMYPTFTGVDDEEDEG